jgi:CBS domain-containing protein
MLIEDVVNFLKKVPPFQFLEEKDLRPLAGKISMEFYPKDTTILKQKGPVSDSLRIIKKGAVKVYRNTDSGEEVTIDYRGEGDTFGLLSLIGDDRQKTSVLALDDTICYLVNKETVFHLLDTNPLFTEYFLKSHMTRYIDRTYDEMHGRTMLAGSTDRLLFTTLVGDIASRQVVTVQESTSIQEASREMTAHKISSLLILDRNNLPAGIITDRDLREKVVARGLDVRSPVSSIMSLPLVRVDARDYCFEAVLKMIKYNIHHLLVIKDGKLQGVITNHDLMILQGTSPLSFAKDIENQITVEGLLPVAAKINNIVGLLFKEGAKADSITKILTEINDRLVRKVLALAEKHFGRPPVPYCWIVFGSEGRKEQTFKTDQDNALIYADPSSETEAREAEKYFQAFSDYVIDGLVKCGFPLCPAGFMSSNPLWRKPLRVWKKFFQTWIADPQPDAVLRSLIFFDFRPLYGEISLGEELRNYLTGAVQDERVFLGFMANKIIKNAPPIGFLRSFVVEKDGEHKDELNLKLKGITPIVDAVRLFALEKGVAETSTIERIEALRTSHAFVQEYAEDLHYAFEFIMLFRINNQYEQIRAGKKPDNFINPNKLSTLEKKAMKDAFSLIGRMQDLIIERYKPMII